MKRPFLMVLGLMSIAACVSTTNSDPTQVTIPGRCGGDVTTTQSRVTIPNMGVTLSPLGRLTTVGNLPTGGALTLDGKQYWAVDSGFGLNDVKIIDMASGVVIQTLPLLRSQRMKPDLPREVVQAPVRLARDVQVPVLSPERFQFLQPKRKPLRKRPASNFLQLLATISRKFASFQPLTLLIHPLGEPWLPWDVAGNNAMTMLGAKLFQLGKMLAPDEVDQGPLKPQLGEPLDTPPWLVLLSGPDVVHPSVQMMMGCILQALGTGTLLTGDVQQLEVVG